MPKTCKDFLQEIEKNISSIISKSENIEVAQALAERNLTLIKKITLDSRQVKDLQRIHSLILVLNEPSKIRIHAEIALGLLKPAQDECTGKLLRKIITQERMSMEKGTAQTYCRIMKSNEYNRAFKTGILESTESGQSIPALKAPHNILEFFMKISRKAIHNLYSQMGGTGDAEHILFFSSNITPILAGPLRNFSGLIEVKFKSGTPIRIVDSRRI